MNTAYTRRMLADNPLTGRKQFAGQPQAGLTLQGELQKVMRLFGAFRAATAAEASVTVREPGLGVGDITAVSRRVTARHGLKARILKPKDNFQA